MPFQFTRASGDFSASGTGSGSPGLLGIGDIATVHVSDPELSDLSGVTVQYDWWVGSTLAGHGTTLGITALDAGQDVKVTISFTHHEFSVSGAVTGTDHELGVVHFGAAYPAPNLHDDAAALADLTSPTAFNTSNLAGNVLANDSSTSPLHVSSVFYGDATHTITGTQTTVGGSYGTLVMHADGNYAFDYNPTAINALTADFHTTLDFSIAVGNGHQSGDIEHLTIQISGANDAPVDHSATLSADIYASWAHTGEGGPTSTYTSGYLGSPSGYVDPEGHSLHFSLSGEAMPGTGYITHQDTYGTFWLYQSGGWSFTIDGSNPAVIALGQSETAQLHFEVGVSDGDGGSTLAEVVVTVHGENDAPHANSDFICAPSVSGAFHLAGNLLANDTDPDTHDHLSVVNLYGSSAGSAAHVKGDTRSGSSSSPVGVEHNSYGTLAVWSDGHYTFNIDPHDPAYIALAPGQTVDLHFSYTISDGHSATSVAGIDVIVKGIDDPAFGYDSTLNFVEDGGADLRLGAVSFTNPDSGTAHVVGIAAPTGSGTNYNWDMSAKSVLGHHWYTVTNDYGTLHLSATSGYYSFTLDNAGTAVQSLAAGQTHIEHFEYKVSDGHGQTDIANVNIVVQGVNDAPHAHDDVYFVHETGNTPSGAIVGSGSGNVASNVLANDTDIDQGTSLHVTSVNRQPPGSVFHTAYGTASLDSNGEFHYHLDQLAADHLGAGQDVTVDFKYIIADSASAIAGADVSVVIVGENDAPTIHGTITDTTLVDKSVTVASGTYHFSDPDSGDTPHVHTVNGVTSTTSTGSTQDLHTWINVQGLYGTLHMSSNGHFEYDLNGGAQALAQSEQATDSFHFTVSDSHGGFASTCLTFDVTGVNDAPVAGPVTLQAQDAGTISGVAYTATSFTVDLLGAATDPDHGDSLHVVGIGTGTDSHFSTTVSTSLGSATVDGSGVLHFHLDQLAVDHLAAGVTEQLVLDYKVADLSGSTDINSITVIVTGANDAPTAQHASTSILAGVTAPAHGTLDYGDPDDGDSVHVAAVNSATFGSGSWVTLSTSYGHLHVSSSGAYSFTVDNSSTAVQRIADGAVHDEHFTYHVADLSGLTATATIDVAITGINDAPVATSHFLAAQESGSAVAGADATGNLLVGASDIDGDTMHVIGLADGTTYLPAITLAYGKASVTAHGSFDFHLDQSAVNHLPAGSNIDFHVDYKISDGHGGTDINSVSVTIHGANDAPTAGSVTTAITEDTPMALGNLLAHAADPDGDSPSVAFVDGLKPGAHISGSHGWLSFTQAGDYSYHLDVSAAQSLTALQSAVDTFTFTISDGHGGTGTAHLNITIDGQNDNPLAGMDAASVTEGVNTTLPGTATGNLLSNDSVGGVSQTIMAVSVDGISIKPSGSVTATGAYGHLHLDSAGCYTYSLDNANVTVDALNVGDVLYDTFDYKASDGLGHWGTAELVVTINGANDAPVASMKLDGTAHEAGVSSSGIPATGDLMSVISDVDNTGAQLAVQSVSYSSLSGTSITVTGNYGQLHVTGHGHYSYDVSNANLTVDALQTGDTLYDCFEYRVEDTHGAWVTNTLDVAIQGHNDAPVVSDLAVCAFEAGSATYGASASGSLLTSSNAFDPEGDSLAVVGVDGQTNNVSTDVAGAFGSLSITASGDFHYNVDQAAANFLAQGATTTDTFHVKVSDGHGGYDLADIVITVNGANDAPVGSHYAVTMTEQGVVAHTDTVHGTAVVNDHDVDLGDVIVAVSLDCLGALTETGDFGKLHLTTHGQFTFQLDENNLTVQALNTGTSISDVFHYKLSDGHGGTAIASITIDIKGSNDAATFSGSFTGCVVEAGGVANASSNTPSASGSFTVSDVDNPGRAQSASGTATYGHFAVFSTGESGWAWSYTLDNSNLAVEALNTSDTLTDSFNVTAADGTVHAVTIMIHGANDAPVAADDTGTAGEAGSATPGFNATGNVLPNDSDVDNPKNLVVAQVDGTTADVASAVDGKYGQLTLNADGSYLYVVDDSAPTVDALGPSGALHDIFSYAVSDGHGGMSTAQLDITIQGANDDPSGTVTINGDPSPGSTLTVTNTLTDPEGVGQLMYQWQADGNDISGANGSSFVMTQAQAGEVIGVVVSYVDGGGTTESVTATTSFVPGQDILGTRANDSLVGGAGDDTIDGAAGHDTMVGGAGNDLYYVNDSRDVVVENPNGGDDTVIATANYVLSANVENLVLSGRAETGKGNALDNVITGDSSSNVIAGLGGADTLTGGAHADTFVYTSTSDSGPTAYDTITDFNAAQKDKIDLRLIDARDNVPGNQSFKFIGTADFVEGANNAGLLRFDPVTHMLEGSTNADANPEFCILLVGVDHIGKDAGGISAANILL